MPRSVKIAISKPGSVDDGKVGEILKIVEECYERLEPHQVDFLDLCFFEASSSIDAFMRGELAKLGGSLQSFSESFLVMHDAWRGIPRISICFERIRNLSEQVMFGAIRHEVGHSVLHGSVEHYLIPTPPSFIALMDRFSLPRGYMADLLYLLSIAIKDYEVTRLLHQRGYIDCQVAYAKYILGVSEHDVLSWEAAKGSALTESLYLVSCLKSVACAFPLLKDAEHGGEIELHISRYLSHLPEDHRGRILKLSKAVLPFLGIDTLGNINQAARAVAEGLLASVLS